MQYKEKLLEMKFDGILNFLGELGREELFKNTKYFSAIQGKLSKEEAGEEFNIITNFASLYKNINVSKILIDILDLDYQVFEVLMPQKLKPPQQNNIQKKNSQ
jgi:hypothetical protein